MQVFIEITDHLSYIKCLPTTLKLEGVIRLPRFIILFFLIRKVINKGCRPIFVRALKEEMIPQSILTRAGTVSQLVQTELSQNP